MAAILGDGGNGIVHPPCTMHHRCCCRCSAKALFRTLRELSWELHTEKMHPFQFFFNSFRPSWPTVPPLSGPVPKNSPPQPSSLECHKYRFMAISLSFFPRRPRLQLPSQVLAIPTFGKCTLNWMLNICRDPSASTSSRIRVTAAQIGQRRYKRKIRAVETGSMSLQRG